MASFEEIRKVRIEKLNKLLSKGLNPYPAKTDKEYSLNEVIEKFDELSKKKSLTLAGRVLAIRGQGALVFINISDGTALFQGLLKKDEMKAEDFDLFVETADLGDFIEITGNLFITKKGQQTLQISTWKILTKSLRPLPDKWDGLQDEEERLRKRYLDVMFNPEVKDLIIKRTKFWNAFREFLNLKGFIEVETPILENTTGGAEAKPFITHHNALGLDVYLRISPELWLKRLMVAGFPKVFEIGRIFRNEGMDAEHLQDYTQMECYQAYSNYEEGMKFVEEMYKFVAEKTFNTLKFKIKNFDIDLEKKWEVYDYTEMIKKMTGVDITKSDLKTIEKKLQELKVDYDKKDGFNLNRGIDNLWKYCRKQIAGPGFLINVPVMMEPLAKRMESNPNLVERFQVILAGSEMGKGFSELNDPLDQMERFKEQAKLREEGDLEAQMTDNEFVEALEYGMPPSFGFGLSERLFSFLANKPLRDCQIFPLLRPKK
ncbi:MAG: lysine--tRNA ligase [Candidatus Taylorbacteria bacterium RIFOXYD2_FULL_36_9]|uniref:Lysine--tRNA ligase n=1 Tax=Candidatus Taylorbacteria bacterium RIFOXYD2_FULL_36_9 TaxID=1802338 RepID=A0A1G2PFZ3_9BACT|nr:MAG: lysine--tRNA ligase [Candidatus Taylorbacteria bacterium RIFOXYD2_FULL_36_9]